MIAVILLSYTILICFRRIWDALALQKKEAAGYSRSLLEYAGRLSPNLKTRHPITVLAFHSMHILDIVTYSGK